LLEGRGAVGHAENGVPCTTRQRGNSRGHGSFAAAAVYGSRSRVGGTWTGGAGQRKLVHVAFDRVRSERH